MPNNPPSDLASPVEAMTVAGAVVIGRNEGERLNRCLNSLFSCFQQIVYVDSGSVDGSIALAESMDVAVVHLDTSVPFTAARARNAGLTRLRQIRADIRYVQFVDGDCELSPIWPTQAISVLENHPDLAAVCGRRRERSLQASWLNRLIDLEWDTPVGDCTSCGGDAFVRVAAFQQVGGFEASLVAGEEPEFCYRLRKAGWKIARLNITMTHHDAALYHFHQWWRRAIRAGYGAYEVWCRCGANREAPFHDLIRSAFVWGIAWPGLMVIAAVLVVLTANRLAAIATIGFMLVPGVVQTLKIMSDGRRKKLDWWDAIAYGGVTLASKYAHVYGCVLRRWRMYRGAASFAIEYKEPQLLASRPICRGRTAGGMQTENETATSKMNASMELAVSDSGKRL